MSHAISNSIPIVMTHGSGLTSILLDCMMRCRDDIEQTEGTLASIGAFLNYKMLLLDACNRNPYIKLQLLAYSSYTHTHCVLFKYTTIMAMMHGSSLTLICLNVWLVVSLLD